MHSYSKSKNLQGLSSHDQPKHPKPNPFNEIHSFKFDYIEPIPAMLQHSMAQPLPSSSLFSPDSMQIDSID